MAKKIPGTTFEENKKYSDLQASIALLKKKKGTDPQLDAELKRREVAAKKFQALYAAAVEKGYTRNLSSSTYADLMQYVDSKNPSAKAGLDAYYEKEGKRPMTPAEKKATALGITTGVVGLLAGLDFAIKGITGGTTGISILATAGSAIPGIVAGIGSGIANMFLFSPVAAGFLTAAALAVPFIIKHRKKIFPRLQEKLAAKNKMKKLDKEATASEKAFNSLMENAGGLDPATINSMSILTPEQKSALLAEHNRTKAAHQAKVQAAKTSKKVAGDYAQDGAYAENALGHHKAAKALEGFKKFRTDATVDKMIAKDAETNAYNSAKGNLNKLNEAQAKVDDGNAVDATGYFVDASDATKTKAQVAADLVTASNTNVTYGGTVMTAYDAAKQDLTAAQTALDSAETALTTAKNNLKTAQALPDTDPNKATQVATATTAYNTAQTDRDAKLAARDTAKEKVEKFDKARAYDAEYNQAKADVATLSGGKATDEATVTDYEGKRYANVTEITLGDGTKGTLHDLLTNKPEDLSPAEEQAWKQDLLNSAKNAGFNVADVVAYMSAFEQNRAAIKEAASVELDATGKKVSLDSSTAEIDSGISYQEGERDAELSICMSESLTGANKIKALDLLAEMKPEEIARLAREHATESTMGG